jgi:hypothetical protein
VAQLVTNELVHETAGPICDGSILPAQYTTCQPCHASRKQLRERIQGILGLIVVGSILGLTVYSVFKYLL